MSQGTGLGHDWSLRTEPVTHLHLQLQFKLISLPGTGTRDTSSLHPHNSQTCCGAAAPRTQGLLCTELQEKLDKGRAAQVPQGRAVTHLCGRTGSGSGMLPAQTPSAGGCWWPPRCESHQGPGTSHPAPPHCILRAATAQEGNGAEGELGVPGFHFILGVISTHHFWSHFWLSLLCFLLPELVSGQHSPKAEFPGPWNNPSPGWSQGRPWCLSQEQSWSWSTDRGTGRDRAVTCFLSCRL